MNLAARIWDWGNACFGTTININSQERSYRFLEESLELVQALDISKEDALRMIDYVYGRPVGEIQQKFGGVGITLHLLASCMLLDVDALTEIELRRCWERIDSIRQKQLGKPGTSKQNTR